MSLGSGTTQYRCPCGKCPICGGSGVVTIPRGTKDEARTGCWLNQQFIKGLGAALEAVKFAHASRDYESISCAEAIEDIERLLEDAERGRGSEE